MNHTTPRRMIDAEFENLLELLTTRQHLAPHEPASRSLERVIGELGVCPNAVAEATVRLGLDSSRSIGRLRRTEILQLARTVYRQWRQPQQDAATTSQRRS